MLAGGDSSLLAPVQPGYLSFRLSCQEAQDLDIPQQKYAQSPYAATSLGSPLGMARERGMSTGFVVKCPEFKSLLSHLSAV